MPRGFTGVWIARTAERIGCEKARKIEDLGYRVLIVPVHLSGAVKALQRFQGR